MFDFIKLQYQMGCIDAEQVKKFAALGYITYEQITEIVQPK